eukprot:TRINITY_DN68152_c2_g1_i2.p1 TRINITY_DN68152_c2_g1~~TRINITY_DN68152_c2_g1_i2.p1  ORF type:complete len:1110 (+),score=516.17 TRINITY_DN68152_c2_g1_i2:340-3330(+)
MPADESVVYVNLIEARNLRAADRSGTADPYACIQMGETNKVFTTTLYKSLDPRWGEEVSFKIENAHDYVEIRVWDEEIVGNDRFLGQVRIPVWEYDDDVLHHKWFKLEPGSRGGKYQDADVSGELHVVFLYRFAEDMSGVGEIKSAKYNQIVQAILSPDMFVARHLLGHLEESGGISTRAGERFMHAVLTVFQNHTFKSTMRILEHCIRLEVDRVHALHQNMLESRKQEQGQEQQEQDDHGKNKNSGKNKKQTEKEALPTATLFRHNTVPPKMLDRFASAVGGQYRADLLRPLVDNICSTVKTFEIDPNRIREKEDIEKNAANLTKKCQKFLDAILDSMAQVPRTFRFVANSIRTIVGERFPDAVPLSVSSFFFLRFLCPAIVAPEHFGIVQRLPQKKKTRVSRFLLLITKTLQSLANRAYRSAQDTDDDSRAPIFKEDYMARMEPFVLANQQRVVDFLAEMCHLEDDADDKVAPSFEHLDKVKLDKSLTVIHQHVHKNITGILARMHAECSQEAAATSSTSSSTAAAESESKQSECVDTKLIVQVFSEIVRRLGPPPMTRNLTLRPSDMFAKHNKHKKNKKRSSGLLRYGSSGSGTGGSTKKKDRRTSAMASFFKKKTSSHSDSGNEDDSPSLTFSFKKHDDSSASSSPATTAATNRPTRLAESSSSNSNIHNASSSSLVSNTSSTDGEHDTVPSVRGSADRPGFLSRIRNRMLSNIDKSQLQEAQELVKLRRTYKDVTGNLSRTLSTMQSVLEDHEDTITQLRLESEMAQEAERVARETYEANLKIMWTYIERLELAMKDKGVPLPEDRPNTAHIATLEELAKSEAFRERCKARAQQLAAANAEDDGDDGKDAGLDTSQQSSLTVGGKRVRLSIDGGISHAPPVIVEGDEANTLEGDDDKNDVDADDDRDLEIEELRRQLVHANRHVTDLSRRNAGLQMRWMSAEAQLDAVRKGHDAVWTTSPSPRSPRSTPHSPRSGSSTPRGSPNHLAAPDQ